MTASCRQAYLALARGGDAPGGEAQRASLGHNRGMKPRVCEMKSPSCRARLAHFARAATLLALLTVSMMGWACDGDADCGAGGTCIKREKRASGVCYGGSRSAPAAAEAPLDEATSEETIDVPIKPVTGERRENAKAWLGDPDQMIKDNLPGKEVGGTCMVTQDCPAGFDCVVAGFEGHCVKL